MRAASTPAHRLLGEDDPPPFQPPNLAEARAALEAHLAAYPGDLDPHQFQPELMGLRRTWLLERDRLESRLALAEVYEARQVRKDNRGRPGQPSLRRKTYLDQLAAYRATLARMERLPLHSDAWQAERVRAAKQRHRVRVAAELEGVSRPEIPPMPPPRPAPETRRPSHLAVGA